MAADFDPDDVVATAAYASGSSGLTKSQIYEVRHRS
jgi:hypothetical protein